MKISKRPDEEELTSWQVGYMILQHDITGEEVIMLVCDMDDGFALINVNRNSVVDHYKKLTSLYNAYHQSDERLVMARVVID